MFKKGDKVQCILPYDGTPFVLQKWEVYTVSDFDPLHEEVYLVETTFENWSVRRFVKYDGLEAAMKRIMAKDDI